MRHSLQKETEYQPTEIITLVSDLIAQTEREKHDRYLTCGCTSCLARATEIEAWLTDNTTLFSAEKRSFSASNQPKPSTNDPAWLCGNCLRKVSSSDGRCYYCNAER